MHRIAALVHPPQSTFELACAAEVFGQPRPGMPSHYAFLVCTEHPGQVATSAGYAMHIDDGLGAMEEADTIVLPGAYPPAGTGSPAVLDAVRRAHRRGARIVSLCSGAFLLAAAGLLDGRRAATHWRMADDFAALFPAVLLDRDVLYVDHGDVATSAGSGAAIDLCLHLVRKDFGAAHADRIARHMVMPPHREGGQLQYAATPARTPDSLAPLLDWAAGRLAEPLPVAVLAARAGVSSRTLARRFAEQLGTGPGQWLLARRIAAAQALLEETDVPVETVAARVGLSSATNLRRRFHQALGTTPAAYRRTFRRPR
ncbi:helix-turn-helix domain-containing protein [Streptomyces sp. NBC_00344]|uniref:helix-turn-helix domain-containing protein n=1 Tax=Streptomyces sp. NBC_00344 TaxID=2975720 RepID=UPI002E22A4D1